MSRYTTQLRYICESIAGYTESVGLSKVEDVLSKCVGKIFDFEYPFYNPDKKQDFEKMILRHFYQDEIGFETYAQWKLELQCWLVENMDYYNKLYLAVEHDFNPLNSIDVTTIRDTNGSVDSNSNTTLNGSYDNWSLFQDTPQGGLDGVRSEKYLSNATHDVNDTQNEQQTKQTDTENRNETITEKGHRENPVKLFNDYIKYVKSIDKLVLNELDKLFMGLWL